MPINQRMKRKMQRMNSHLVTWITVGLLVGAASAFAQLPTAKIVTVDLNQVFNEYYKTPIAQMKLKEAAASYNKEHQEMMDEFKKQVDELNKLREDAENPAYTPEEREQKRKAVT